LRIAHPHIQPHALDRTYLAQNGSRAGTSQLGLRRARGWIKEQSMRAKVFCSLTRSFLCASMLWLAAFPVPGQDRFLGLKLASPEQLRGIPLASLPFSGAELPRAVDLSKDLPPPGQQGRQMSCVGWSVAYALKSYHEKLEEKWSLTDNNGRPDVKRVFSPAFIYNQINNGRDGGSYIYEALNLLSAKGAAPWADMPYRADDYTAPPPPAALDRARRYRTDYWRRVNVVDSREVKAQLNAGYPVVIGAKVDEDFLKLGRDQVWSSIGQVKGGHAMLVVGYNDYKGAFRVINSWGQDWADGGYGWIDYRLFSQVVNEGFVVKDAINGAGPAPPVQPTNADPTRPPTPAPELAFKIDRVQHNVPTAQGYYLTVEGTVKIPAGRGQWSQAVVYFFFDAGAGRKGVRVPATISNFADVYGYAATGTQGFWNPPTGVDSRWTAYIPYSAFNTGLGWVLAADGQYYYRRGSMGIVAEAVLFIDNFGVMNGGTFGFPVNY
jgi:hypothetical protein